MTPIDSIKMTPIDSIKINSKKNTRQQKIIADKYPSHPPVYKIITYLIRLF